MLTLQDVKILGKEKHEIFLIDKNFALKKFYDEFQQEVLMLL